MRRGIELEKFRIIFFGVFLFGWSRGNIKISGMCLSWKGSLKVYCDGFW